ncbi:MAG TPA: hypothetical protein VMZ33_06930 [Candidatus Limnocylindrales bacterium]|nr:hypothetical protein [Candidatus Limnocylindrales bacterium]
MDALAGVLTWLRYQWPPTSWRLVAVEAEISPGGRPDLWWQVGGMFVADEVKTGLPARSWETQFAQQRANGNSQYGNRFLGLRVFATSDPCRSLWLGRDGVARRLHTTPFWFPSMEHRDDA